MPVTDPSFFLQVSEVYSLHRQTTYLAQDFFDRFMLTQEDVRKETLQLLGITALFIASKIEVGLTPSLRCPLQSLPTVADQAPSSVSTGDLPAKDL